MRQHPAPLSFIEDYYEKRLARRMQYPQVLRFYEEHLRKVSGKCVLNIGCGPQFYDDLHRFGGVPKTCIGIDLNQSTFDFLANADYPEVIAGKSHAQLHGVATELICGDIFDVTLTPASFDNVVSIGFLGIFAEDHFVQAIQRVRGWLRPGGVLLNMSWCGNHQDEDILADRLRYQFNHPDNPGPDDIVRWAQNGGLELLDEARYDVPDKLAYGWECVHASSFVKLA